MKVLDSRKFLIVAVSTLLTTLVVQGASRDIPSIRDLRWESVGETVHVTIIPTEKTRYSYFELSSPSRLVVDFHGAENDLTFKERAVGSAGVERIRASAYRNKSRAATRVVFDLARRVPFKVLSDDEGVVRVTFGESAPAVSHSVTAAAVPVPVPEAPKPQRRPAPAQQAAAPEAAKPKAAAALPQGTAVQLASNDLIPAPEMAKPAPASTAAGVPLQPESPPSATAGEAPVPARRQDAPAQASIVQCPPTQFTGEIISLDLRDFDVKDFFRLVSEISGLNVVLDPAVAGTVTLNLKDVPWDQALGVVLRNNALGCELQGNVLRIAAAATLKSEQDNLKAFRDSQAQAADVVTRTYVLNYTRADAVTGVIQSLLSDRGKIITEGRRNALIITDVAGTFANIDQMVKFVDAPAQQVEIEGRLLSAARSFSKELGSQIGVLIGNGRGNAVTGINALPSPVPRAPSPRIAGDSSGTRIPLNANFPAAATSGLAVLLGAGGDVLLDEIITAAEANGTAKLISRPRVTTQNNQLATVEQGTQIPVQTNVNNTISVQFLTFSLKLEVTPQITDAGTILLQVTINNASPDFARAVNGIPSVATQTATTKVLVPDGGTAVIGGILLDNDSVNVQQVPGLGSIPVIGYLFKRTQVIKSTSELLFFVTARIKADNPLSLGNTPPARQQQQ